MTSSVTLHPDRPPVRYVCGSAPLLTCMRHVTKTAASKNMKSLSYQLFFTSRKTDISKVCSFPVRALVLSRATRPSQRKLLDSFCRLSDLLYVLLVETPQNCHKRQGIVGGFEECSTQFDASQDLVIVTMTIGPATNSE